MIIITAATLYFSLHNKLPEGKHGPEADELALKIQKAVKHDAYLNTDFIQWSFRNKHHYLWNKSNGTVEVRWDDHKVALDLTQPDNSKVYTEAKAITDNAQKQKLIGKALAFFNNDSFWVVAPHKLFDQGVTREIVTLEDDSNALLVTYQSGGTTPGDSYLWKVDENYLPTSYQMWVSILPIGGVEATWTGWTNTESGAYLSQKHRLAGFEIPISNLRAWNSK